LGRGAVSPSNTVWPGPRPTCMPSFILIYPTVWPQYTYVTDRQDRQTGQTDNGLIAWSPKNYVAEGKEIASARYLAAAV